MGPFDYSVNMGNPLGAFTQSFGQGLQLRGALDAQAAAMQQRQLEQQQMNAQMQQQQVLRQAMTEFAAAQSPAEQVAVMSKYPAFAEPLRKQSEGYDGAIKAALYEAAIKPYALLKGGDSEGAIRQLKMTAEAFRNSNRPQFATAFDEIAKIAEASPQSAMTMAGAYLAANNAKEFEQFGKALDQGGLTGFQKDLQAAGIDPDSDEGKRQSRQYVQNRVDPIVTMETPSGAQFIGPMSVYTAKYGQAPAGAQRLPTVSTAEQYAALAAGQQFVDPQGNVRTKR
jgi:2-oxo-4-hydroxy-4-carboxy--5-ureidoimidazoline (OHCU) decarboxylase